MKKQRRQFLSQLTSHLAGIGTLAAAPALTQAASSHAQIKNIRISREPNKTRLVFDCLVDCHLKKCKATEAFTYLPDYRIGWIYNLECICFGVSQ